MKCKSCRCHRKPPPFDVQRTGLQLARAGLGIYGGRKFDGYDINFKGAGVLHPITMAFAFFAESHLWYLIFRTMLICHWNSDDNL